MGPLLILARAAQAGVALSVRAGTVYAAPPGLLPAALVDEIRAHKSELVDLLATSPGCTSCAGPVDDARDLLCQPCYSARRAPGRVLPFDPDRRLRTEQRLAARRCETCGGSWYRVHPNGDAECEPCRRNRAVTPETRTNGVPPLGSAP